MSLLLTLVLFTVSSKWSYSTSTARPGFENRRVDADGEYSIAFIGLGVSSHPGVAKTVGGRYTPRCLDAEFPVRSLREAAVVWIGRRVKVYDEEP